MKLLFSKTALLTLLATLALVWAIPQLKAQEGWQPTPPMEDELKIPGAPAADDFEKEMVDIPPQEEKSTIDASDFRDPFFFLKTNDADAKDLLKPGTTVDGLRFNTYNDSIGFVDRYYKNSNFVLEDVFGRIDLVNQEAGCLNCHRGIEEISQNHQFSCTKCHGGNLSGKTPAQAHRGLVSNPSDLNHAPQYCGKCHEEISNTFMESAHGISLMAGNFESPNCTTCHGSHEILEATHPLSLTSPHRLSKGLCAQCHGYVSGYQ